jgi:ankyrin repeat protein
MRNYSQLSQEQAQKLFCSLVVDGQVAELRDLLAVRGDIDLNQPEEEGPGEPMLLNAVKRGQADIVEVLLEAGADVEVADEQGITPFLAAIEVNDAEKGRMLLKAGADAFAEDMDGRDAMALCRCKDADFLPVLKLLLNSGHSPSGYAPDEGTLLFDAAENNLPDVADALLEAGCDPFIENAVSDRCSDVAEAWGAPQVAANIREHMNLPCMKDEKFYDAEELFRPRNNGNRLVDNPANWWNGMEETFEMLAFEDALPNKSQLLAAGESGKSAAEVAFAARKGELVMQCLKAHGEELQAEDLFADGKPTALADAMCRSGEAKRVLQNDYVARFSTEEIRHIYHALPEESRGGMGLFTLVTQAAQQRLSQQMTERGR